MFRRSAASLGVIRVIREELAKAFAVARFDTAEYGKLLKGEDGMSEEQLQRAAKVRAKYAEAASAQAPRPTAAPSPSAAAPKEPTSEATAAAAQTTEQHKTDQGQEQTTASSSSRAPQPLTLAERWSHLKAAMYAAFSPKAGVAAIIDHCTKAHAAEVAADLDVDVKSVQVQTEKASVGEGSRVVGYIDAPAASAEEVLVFAQRLQKACPAARSYGDIEWRQGPPPRS